MGEVNLACLENKVLDIPIWNANNFIKQGFTCHIVSKIDIARTVYCQHEIAIMARQNEARRTSVKVENKLRLRAFPRKFERTKLNMRMKYNK